jgi:uncharacterized protein (DUF1684 family)
MSNELRDFRRGKDAFFRDVPDSPLSPEQRAEFKGLSYFDEDPKLRLVLQPERLDQPTEAKIPLSTGGDDPYERWGRVRFEVEGKPAELMIYREPDSGNLFLPFKDTTAASGETYGAGRYVEVEEAEDGAVLIDFNFAYNPYCAYNEGWTCPLTPPENNLDVPIRAGEKAFEGH